MLTSYAHDRLTEALQEIERKNSPQFWSFQGSAPRRGAHALLHYPAMMVPDLQGTILSSITRVAPGKRRVLDPFAGSGTVLVEAMQLGLDFCGVDINPLAGLACLVKAGPYDVRTFTEKSRALITTIQIDQNTHLPREFAGRDKWFSPNVASDLEKISYHVRQEPELWLRRLFWLALCRVVRSVSNSRISTYKLHKRPDNEISIRRDPIALFSKSLNLFETSLSYQYDILNRAGLLNDGRYQGDLKVEINDNAVLMQESFSANTFDIVMTSPPYGDNRTTIPYGQFAYLPLHWIDIEDINENIDKGLLANTHATDSASLGGSLRSATAKLEELSDTCKSAREFISKIANNSSGKKRFSTFFFDFMKSVDRISSCTSENGYHAWTIGNRRIAGELVPMDSLLAEILEKNGINVIGKIERDIHSKKMASRNRSSDTMTSEKIMLGKKAKK